MQNNSNKLSNSINNLNIPISSNAISSINVNNKPNIYKNQTSNKDNTRENFYKEIHDSESNYANKDNENLLRKSTDFYFLPKIKYQNNSENALNKNGYTRNLFKNKTININNSNNNFGYKKNDGSINNNLFENNNNDYATNNDVNTNNTNIVNTTDSHSNTFFYNPLLKESTGFKNYNYIDESYNYRFKPSPRKSMITTNFNNTSNNKLKFNLKEEKNSISISQKKLDFKSILESEKYEEEKRMQHFFKKLNMSSINNFPNFSSAKNLNISNNNNFNSTNAKFISGKNIHKENINLNNNENNSNYEENTIYNFSNNNVNSLEKNKDEKSLNHFKNQTTKNSSSNSLLYKKENNRRNTQSSNNLNCNLINQIENYMNFAPKNNYEAIRPLMTKSTENVLNSIDTIKNRNKIKIINKKLQISKEIPMQSYVITNIKPPCLFDFNNKLKGQVVLNKEIELQKKRYFQSNPEAYYEDEEIELNSDKDSEKENELKGSFARRISEKSYQLIKKELELQNSSAYSNNQNDKNNNKNENSKNENEKITLQKTKIEKTEFDNFDKKNSNEAESKGIILNYLIDKRSATTLIPQHNASEDNSFTIRNSEKNYFINQNLNDISENACSSELNSSFRNENQADIKAKFQRKFENEEKLKVNNSNEINDVDIGNNNNNNNSNNNFNINIKNESDYFNDKDGNSNTAFNTSRKVSIEKNSFGLLFTKKPAIKEDNYLDADSIEESVASLHEDKIHNLDDSGILQVKRHESLYIKANRKLSKGNNFNKKLSSMLSIKPNSISPNIRKTSENNSIPNFQINLPSPQKLSINSNFNTLNINDDNKINNSNQNLIENKTVENSPDKKIEANKQLTLSSNMLNINQSFNINSLNKETKADDNDKNNINLINLSEHDFEAHEVEPNLKTKTEINKIKKKINEIKKKRFDFKSEFLNDVHKRLQKKAFELNPDYQSTKDVLHKYKQEKILEKYDFNISSRLYLQNRNPIFQVNNMISFPQMIDDPVFLANIYNVNMYKLETSAKNKIN